VATLFQPERSAITGAAHPLITEFVRVCASARLDRAARPLSGRR
jgi:hypothetical protein